MIFSASNMQLFFFLSAKRLPYLLWSEIERFFSLFESKRLLWNCAIFSTNMHFFSLAKRLLLERFLTPFSHIF